MEHPGIDNDELALHHIGYEDVLRVVRMSLHFYQRKVKKEALL